MALRFPAKKVLVPVLASAVLCFACGGDGGRLVRQDIGAESQTQVVEGGGLRRVRPPSGHGGLGTRQQTRRPGAHRNPRGARPARRARPRPLARRRAPGSRRLVPRAQPRDPGSVRELRRREQPGQLQHLRFPRQPARPRGRRRPQSLRRDDQPGLRGLQQDRNLLVGPVDTGTLWADFPIEDCTDPSGDPIVVYDQLEDRWLLSQFTTRGLVDPAAALLQLRRHLRHRRSHGRVLPLRLHHAARRPGWRLLLPRLSEVRSVEEDVRPHHP